MDTKQSLYTAIKNLLDPTQGPVSVDSVTEVIANADAGCIAEVISMLNDDRRQTQRELEQSRFEIYSLKELVVKLAADSKGMYLPNR